MNFRSIGWLRAVRGLRDGDQGLLYTGLGLVLLHHLSSTKPKRKLVYRKRLPVGSTVVVRHVSRGEPRIEIVKPQPAESHRRRQSQTR